MKDAQLNALAAAQFNRFSRAQLGDLGFSKKTIRHRVATGRLVHVMEGVYSLPPFIDDDEGRWMAATLTAPNSFINRLSAACAYGILDFRPPPETIVRPGLGGPRRLDGLLVYRSTTLEGETTRLDGKIPITTIGRTLLDLACFASDKALARALRDSVRLKRVSKRVLGDDLGRFEGRKGGVRLAETYARYLDLPIERAKSGAEIRAMEMLRDAGRPLPDLNFDIAGEEADLIWRSERLIIEIDGGPFHQDRGKDACKEAAWRDAGWRVERLPSDDVYETPWRLLDIAP